MKTFTRRQLLKGAGALGLAGATARPAPLIAASGNAEYQWDIVNIFGGCLEAGGSASSKARDGARITMTGSGTFRENPGFAQNATGGGTWAITAGTATPAGSGTYEVTRFISFTLAPGAIEAVDCIGNVADARAGRATFAIGYDDGSEGVLEVGCRLFGTPASVMEGLTATKGFVTFWNHEEPAPGVEGNRTLFHVIG